MSDPLSAPLEAQRKARQKLILVVAIAVVVAIIAITVGVLMQDDEKTSSRKGLGTSQPNDSDDGDDGVVELPDLANLIPPQELQSLEWKTRCGMYTPTSSEHGPKNVEAGRSKGFSRDALGALIASIHLPGCAGVNAGSDVFEPTILNQFDGGGKEELLAATQETYERKREQFGVQDGDPIPDEVLVPKAFRFSAFSKEAAIVRIVLPLTQRDRDATGSTHFDVEIHLKWKSGDWRTIAPKDGQWGNAFTFLKSPDGYTAFPGN